MYRSGIEIFKLRLPLCAAVVMATLACGKVSGQGLSLESVGIRAGGSLGPNGRDFHQIDAFLNANLPWRWDLGKAWSLQTRLDLSAGWLGWTEQDTAVLTVGPSLLFRRDGFPLSFEGGSSPTVLSRYDLSAENFGEPLQFTTHLGINWDFGRHFRIGYWFQHMSNAGIVWHNPGLNLHMIKVSYLF